MDFSWLIDFIRTEWAVVAGAPLLSFVLFVAGLAAGWAVVKWVYASRLDFAREQIEEYRQRLGDIPRDTAYMRLSNRELRRRTKEVVKQLREFERRFRGWQSVGIEVKREAGEGDRFVTYPEIQAMNAPFQRFMTEFTDRFGAETLNLRDELRRRLPPGVVGDEMDHHAFVAANPTTSTLLANTLERMALQLSVSRLSVWARLISRDRAN